MYPIALTLLVYRLGILITTLKKKLWKEKKDLLYSKIDINKSCLVASVAWVIKSVGVFLHLLP